MASYFCLCDGTVIHAVAGQLNAQEFLREAKWAVEVRKLAATEAGGVAARYRASLRKAHLERLQAETGLRLTPNALPPIEAGAPPVPSNRTLRGAARGTGVQGQVHILLAQYPLPKLAQLYPIVFHDVLGEKLSTLPVKSR